MRSPCKRFEVFLSFGRVPVTPFLTSRAPTSTTRSWVACRWEFLLKSFNLLCFRGPCLFHARACCLRPSTTSTTTPHSAGRHSATVPARSTKRVRADPGATTQENNQIELARASMLSSISTAYSVFKTNEEIEIIPAYKYCSVSLLESSEICTYNRGYLGPLHSHFMWFLARAKRLGL